MKRLLRSLCTVALLAPLWAASQSSYDQRQLLYSTNSTPTRGVNWAPQPAETLPPEVNAATPGQFRGAIVFGGVTKQGNTNSFSGTSFAGIVDQIDWPRSTQNSSSGSILRAAVGMPYLSHGYDYQFGQVITPPDTDISGALLGPSQANYWHPEPVYIKKVGNSLVLDTSADHAGADYYWSPHKQAAYATKAGQATITWRIADSTTTSLNAGAGEAELTTHVKIGNYYYALKKVIVAVSPIPVQPARRMYWTEGDYERTGKPILVPSGVRLIRFVYNSNIPETVPESAVVPGAGISGSASGPDHGTLPLHTKTIRTENGFIVAYNKEGRIFAELLGDATGPTTRRQLGVEIIEVSRNAVPADVAIDLGERITAYPGNQPSDADWRPEPIGQIGTTYAYQHAVVGSGKLEYYATHVTRQLTDFQVYWMETGVGGLLWPVRFVRYSLVWPEDSSKYNHYVRPEVEDETAAMATAVVIPRENAPVLEDQDPSTIATARAKLTADSRFYTFLDSNQPAHRALLRYNVGLNVAFERVFSWLDAGLKNPRKFVSNPAVEGLGIWRQDPPAFGTNGFLNIEAFAAKLSNPTDDLTRAIYASLSQNSINTLSQYHSESPKSAATESLLGQYLSADIHVILTEGLSPFSGSLPGAAVEGPRNWSSVACSSDGSVMVATVDAGRIYVSTDSGTTWTPVEDNRGWESVAVSGDGKYMAAVSARPYVSADFGRTWTQRTSLTRDWASVASSLDGMRLIAANRGGNLFRSIDRGSTWASLNNTGEWSAVASSADGSRLVAVENGGKIHISDDSGESWSARESNRSWRSVASSSDGSKLVAVVDAGRIYVSSNSGTTWSARESSRNWISVASSSSGHRLLAAVENGPLVRTEDSGSTWAAFSPSGLGNRVWRGAALSADGATAVAVENAGSIHIFRSLLKGSNYAERRRSLESAYPEELAYGLAWLESFTGVSPRVLNQNAVVGQRVEPPDGELGGGSDSYWAGYIHQVQGTSFSTTAYHDPFVDGFDEANGGAILPVNAAPGKDRLEVWWFRRHASTVLRDDSLGFLPTYWPSVIGRYSLVWPDPGSSSTASIVLASNQGSGPLDSLMAAGHLYFQNSSDLPGYNPNEEHALMQGGRVWALRDDLNVTQGVNFTSQPYALLEYKDADSRPNMRAFHVVRENESFQFNYSMDAGLVLQPPMPLPLLEKPIPPGQTASLNAEASRTRIEASSSASIGSPSTTLFSMILENRFPPYRPYEKVAMEKTGEPTFWMLTTGIDPDLEKVEGFVSEVEPTPMSPWTGEAAASASKLRFAAVQTSGITVGNVPNAIVAKRDSHEHWLVTVTEVGSGYVEVLFGSSAEKTLANGADILLFSPETSGNFAGYDLTYEKRANSALGEDLAARYSDLTFQDRKGDIWIYRGPHDSLDPAVFVMQYYYKTLPGFWFPVDGDEMVLGADGVKGQPEVGTITPYLRMLNTAGDGYLGDSVNGNSIAPTLGDANPLPIRYQARWPAGAPVMQMAETLSDPKRGLPAIRGQTSAEVLYQQSLNADPEKPSVVLHDPTAAKKFRLVATDDNSVLHQLPPSIQTSVYRGKTYFPRLAPHLVDRFYFDPNDGKFGSLVFTGEFRQETLGESYLLLNLLSNNDTAALQGLCEVGQEGKTQWDNAIAELQLTLSQYEPNPALPGTYAPGSSRIVSRSDLVEILHSDEAVDSYALTAVGPGTGYVSVIVGQGRAFTPPEEPVSVKIIRIVDSLQRGEVKVVQSSNPLAEKVTLQQIVDLAGKVGDFDFEWWIAAPVDGAPPPVYASSRVGLISGSTQGTWQHLPFPLPGEGGASLGVPQSVIAPERVLIESRGSVVPVSSVEGSVSAVPAGLSSILSGLFPLVPDLGAFLSKNGGLLFRMDSGSIYHPEEGSSLGVTSKSGDVVKARVEFKFDSDSSTYLVLAKSGAEALPSKSEVLSVSEGVAEELPQSIVYQDFTIPSGSLYSEYYLSLDLNDALGAKVYVDGVLAVTANLENPTPTSTVPSDLAGAALSKTYRLGPEYFAGGANEGSQTRHRVLIEAYSAAAADAVLALNLRLDAYESIDLVDAPGSQWLKLDDARSPDKVRIILGENADVRALSDNYAVMRYRAKSESNFPDRSKEWSQWTDPVLVEGWIKRVLAGINPFTQRTEDLLSNPVSTEATILTAAGKRWEGDVALNLDSIGNYGLIEIYETVLRRGKDLSINAGISYDPANDALLLAAGYLNDLYLMLGNEARTDASNPTIGIGTKDRTYGEISTSLYSFKGQLPSLLEEELAMLRGRDDFLQPGVRLQPVYNRLVWNYTRGINSGEVIYALNYNILDQNNDGKVDAADAAILYPQGHGDAYGHYLTGLKGYYSLLLDRDFAWVPRIEAVNVLGKPVAVDYQDERKFAQTASALARTGRQIFELTWRKDYQPGGDAGWSHFSATRQNSAQSPPTERFWGVDHWASRTGQGAYLHWAMGNSMLPAVDPDPTHEGIQKVDRTTVPELAELAATAGELQAAMDNAEGHASPLGIAPGGLAFDMNPNEVTGADPKPHFEQVYRRALTALNNAVASFDDAKDVTRLMRSEQDSLEELQAAVARQEQSYTTSLIELYGTPYPDDIGPGKTYKQDYDGPDLFHYRYVETETIEAPGVYTPNDPEYVARIDIQQLALTWSYPDNLPRTNLSTDGPVDGTSDDLVIVNANTDKYEETDEDGKPIYYISYPFGSHGFFDKPEAWTSARRSPGKIQQAISELIQAHDRMYYALAAQCESDKQDLDKAVQVFESLRKAYQTGGSIRGQEQVVNDSQLSINKGEVGYAIASKGLENLLAVANNTLQFMEAAIPDTVIFGVSYGGDINSPLQAGLYATTTTVREILQATDSLSFVAQQIALLVDLNKQVEATQNAIDAQREEDMKAAIFDLGNRLKAVQGDFQVINEKLRILDDAKRKYAALVAEGDRILHEREVFRQRSAALIQGFRTRDAAFRIFKNEKLERYSVLFDLAARYALLSANAFDYETGLLNTPKGRAFVNRIVNARALGVVKNGEPQSASGGAGDPGLASILAEMKADWDVLKGRLGFNNPVAYGTTFSLRTEKHRILPGASGADAWKDVLNKSRKGNLLEDSDIRRFCMQIDPGNGLSVPGLVVEFETSIADGYNFFGQELMGFDHAFDSSDFATKIFAVGVALEGYVGMDDPGAGATFDSTFLNPNSLSATPGVYLIPVGLDSMRSPALGDQGAIRTWAVDDVTIPLPFNIGGSDFSSGAFYQSSDSLSEPLFGIRKHPSFRPVSNTAAFSTAIYGANSALQRSQFTNTRLIGRSVWNSKWKLVIPGSKLLHDPDEGLERFIHSVTDIKLHFVTYSYSGN